MSKAFGDPGSLAMLERRLATYAGSAGQTFGRARVTMGQVVVAQMLPDTLVKGGSGMKFRLGAAFTRDSRDLDTAWRSDQASFSARMTAMLQQGWGPFRGTLREQPQRPKPGIPTAYLMQPYIVKLNAYNRPFGTVILEVGYDELNATEEQSAEHLLSADILEMFAACGLPEPAPVPVIAVHHQVAQKVHACTEPGSDRAHDLVDLQLLWPEEEAALLLIADTTRRIFAFRSAHTFPGKCVALPGWETAYAVAAEGLPVLPSAPDAVNWLNARLSELAEISAR